MKKHLLILSLATLAFSITSVKAQLISASADDFETWSADPANGSAMDPNGGAGSPGWQCFNIMSSLFTGSSPVSVFQESSIVHSGKYSCKITSVPLSSTSYAYVKTFIPTDTTGIVVSGTIVTSPSPAFKLGVPFTNRISQLVFWYQYMPQTAKTTGKPDTAFCTVALTQKHIPIGGGTMTMTAASNWTLVTVPITYSGSGNPDTAIVYFSASSFTHPALGSILYVDGESVVAGVDEIQPVSEGVSVYPNPASREINFSITGAQVANNIEIFDITGQQINNLAVTNNFVSANTSTVASGLYFYKVLDKSGNLIKTGKFSVVR